MRARNLNVLKLLWTERLDLADNRLSGTIPNSFGQLSYLGTNELTMVGWSRRKNMEFLSHCVVLLLPKKKKFLI